MEGPAVKIASDQLQKFNGLVVLDSFGNAKIDIARVRSKMAEDIFSRGKQLLIRFNGFHIRVHFMMFGSYLIDGERKGARPRLGLDFESGKVRFYNCSVRMLEGPLPAQGYGEEIDICGDAWSMQTVFDLCEAGGPELVCDLLMDQNIFAGVGNMIKNEALYDARVHPLSVVERIPDEVLRLVVSKTRKFSLRLYEVERSSRRLDSIFRVYRKRDCECGGRVRVKKTGRLGRVSYFCPSCQVLYE